jgi:hypothetical protein
MDFSTDLIKLMPRKYHSIEAWSDFFEKVGEIMNDIHVKIDGLADFHDADNIPEEYMPYLAELYGFSLVVKPGTEDAARRRQLLKSVNHIIRSKGLGSLMASLIQYLYFVEFPEASVDIYELWTTDYVNFTINRPLVYETPSGWTGDGSTKHYTGTLTHIPVKARSIKITTTAVDDTALEAWSDGTGALRGDLESAGTINNTTGDIDLTFSKNVKNGVDIVVSYLQEDGRYLSPHYVIVFPADIYFNFGLTDTSEYPAGWVGNGSQTVFSTTLTKFPIGIESVRITAEDIYGYDMVVTDDGSGYLVGDVASGYGGTIDYDTGAVYVEFDTPVASGLSIKVEYKYKNLFTGKEVFADMMAYIDKFRPVHTVVTVDIGQADDFWQVDEVHGVVDGPGSPVVPDEDKMIIGSSIWQ